MKTVGVLWDEEVDEEGFTRKELEEAYREFDRIASRQNLRIVHGSYTRYGNSKLEAGFVTSESGTEEVNDEELDAVFDKFKFDSSTKELKREMNDEVPVLNCFELERLCKDKLETYREFPEQVPRTIEASVEEAERMIERSGKVVVKPRFDFGGRGVEVVQDIDELELGEGTLLQEFVDSSSGIRELDIEGMHDLRVLVASGEPVAAYVRQPDEGFIANVSLGGSMEFVELSNVPHEAAEIVEGVMNRFERFSPSFYSVDMIFDGDESARILEFNSKPGLTYHGDENIRAKKLPVMEKVVEQLAKP